MVSAPAPLPDFSRLAVALRAHDAVVVTWLDGYASSGIRVPRPLDRGAMGQRIAPIIEALADALAASRRPGGPPGVAHLVIGSSELREVEKATALLGAGMAAGDDSGFDVTALLLAMRGAMADVTDGEARRQIDAFAEWLAAVALDAFAGARVAAERERWREQLEEGTPVLLVAPEVPAAFLIGRPDARLLDALFARLLLLAVRVGARRLLIEASGLADPGHAVVLGALDRFVSHPKLAKVELCVIGLDGDVEATWLETVRKRAVAITAESHFDRAVETALGMAGYRLLHP